MVLHAAEARELIVERQVVQECAEWNHHEREFLIQFEATHVGLDNDDPIAFCLRQLRTLVSKPSEHAVVRIERVDGRALSRDRQREAPGSGPQLENRPAGFPGLADIPLSITSKRGWRREIIEIRVVRAQALVTFLQSFLGSMTRIATEEPETLTMRTRRTIPAIRAGAKSVEDPMVMRHGDRRGMVEDPCGQRMADRDLQARLDAARAWRLEFGSRDIYRRPRGSSTARQERRYRPRVNIVRRQRDEYVTGGARRGAVN